VPVRIAQGKRAEDHFHPSDEGYSLIAADFAAAIAARERPTPASGGDETSVRQRPGGSTPPKRLCGLIPACWPTRWPTPSADRSPEEPALLTHKRRQGAEREAYHDNNLVFCHENG
jgi:hypothetical protein